MGELGILGVLFFVILGILWACLPFALFGIKPRLDRIHEELQAIRAELNPHRKVEPK
jgi:hypothetical protein